MIFNRLIYDEFLNTVASLLFNERHFCCDIVILVIGAVLFLGEETIL